MEVINTVQQTIVLSGKEEPYSSNVIYGNEIDIETLMTSHRSGSSAVVTCTITNYPWDQVCLSGSLVAVHCQKEYIAYAIKDPQRSKGMVRVIHRRTGSKGLIKNVKGIICDVSFAFIKSRIIVAFTDTLGTLYVYEIFASPSEGQLSADLLLEVESATCALSEHHRVIWCNYVPDSAPTEESNEATNDEADYHEYQLLLTHDALGEIWNVSYAIQDHGVGALGRELLTAPDAGHFYTRLEHHTAPITDASFSPDGTALAVASLDGSIKFLQVYLTGSETTPRCLHEWNPHNGKPVSSVLFLDDYTNSSPEVQYWKYALTGACGNTEMRIWSCESWICHQTIRLIAPDNNPKPALKATVDPTGNIVVLSDSHRRVLYVLLIGFDNGGINDASPAKVISFTEVCVQYPLVSLTLTEFAWKRYKRHQEMFEDDEEELESCSPIESPKMGIIIRGVVVSTKSLQDTTIRILPALPSAGIAGSMRVTDFNSSRESAGIRDGLSDLSLPQEADQCPLPSQSNDLVSPPLPPPVPLSLSSPHSSFSAMTPPAAPPMSAPLSLLTPDSFHSPRKVEENDAKSFRSMTTPKQFDPSSSPSFLSHHVPHDILSSVISGTSLPSPPLGSESNMMITGNLGADIPLATSEPQLPRPSSRGEGVAGAGNSCASSPSLEVEHILHDQNGKSDEDESDSEVMKSSSSDDNQQLSPAAQPPVQQLPQPSFAHLTPQSSVAVKLEMEKLMESLTEKGDQLTCAELEAKMTLAPGNGSSRVPENDILGMMFAANGNVTRNRNDLASSSDVQELRSLLFSNEKTFQDTNLDNIKCQQSMTTKIERIVQQITQMNKQLEEIKTTQSHSIKQLPQVVASSLRPSLEATVRSEMRGQVMPALTKCLDPVKSQLLVESQNLTKNAQNNINDSLGKLIQSRPFVDKIGSVVSSSVSQSVHTSCREAFNKVVVPGFTSVSQQVFTQINDSFTRGTREYLQNVEKESQKGQTNVTDNISKATQSLNAVCVSLSSHLNLLQEQVKQLNIHQQQLNDSMGDRIRILVREEISRALHEQQIALEAAVGVSRGTTPSPGTPIVSTKVLQQQLQLMISQGQLNNAFKQALSASDLSVVMFVCERVNPTQIFSHVPCPLSQDVLLSLVNQLAHDLTTTTELKLKYLEGAVVNFDAEHPVTKEHLRPVLQGLQHSLNSLYTSSPHNKKVKMLSMAVASLSSQ